MSRALVVQQVPTIWPARIRENHGHVIVGPLPLGFLIFEEGPSTAAGESSTMRCEQPPHTLSLIFSQPSRRPRESRTSSDSDSAYRNASTTAREASHRHDHGVVAPPRP